MMGGDFAPLEAVKGIGLYLEQRKREEDQREKDKEAGASDEGKVQLTLFGDEAQIKSLLEEHQIDLQHIKIVPTSQVVDMHEHPTKALKEKQDSSIAVGFGYARPMA